MKTCDRLMRQSMEMLVLMTLARGPTYGYHLLKRIRGMSGLGNLNAGAVYPALHGLESAGLVASTWDRRTRRPRKWYQLSEPGQRALRDQAAQWREYVQIIKRDLEPALAALSGEAGLPLESD